MNRNWDCPCCFLYSMNCEHTSQRLSKKNRTDNIKFRLADMNKENITGAIIRILNRAYASPKEVGVHMGDDIDNAIEDIAHALNIDPWTWDSLDVKTNEKGIEYIYCDLKK